MFRAISNWLRSVRERVWIWRTKRSLEKRPFSADEVRNYIANEDTEIGDKRFRTLNDLEITHVALTKNPINKNCQIKQ